MSRYIIMAAMEDEVEAAWRGARIWILISVVRLYDYYCMTSLGDCMTSLGDCMTSLGDCMTSLGDCMTSLGDCMTSLGDLSHRSVIV